MNEDSILNGKPIIWIHNEHNINARNWLSFMSRNSKELNQPYLNTCVETIIKHNNNSFNIGPGTLDQSTNTITIKGESETVKILALLTSYCELTNNHEAMSAAKQFAQEAVSDVPNKNKLFDYWTSIVSSIPTIKNVVEIVQAVQKFFV